MTERVYEAKIRTLAETAVEAEGMELICVECLRMKSSWIVRLYLDKEGGVTLDDCAIISNLVGDILDVNDIPPGKYTLEVSSPGPDRPLCRDKDFIRFRGADVFVKSAEKIDGTKNFHGKLVDLVNENNEQILLLDVGGRICRIPRENVTKARLDQLPSSGLTGR